MICGCCKDLGCFSYGSIIQFGVTSLTDGIDYTFHIWNNGTYTTTTTSPSLDEELTLPYTFNENSETTIKIELPSMYVDSIHGIKFVTTSDGACCFTANGIIKQCN